jgi:hypothetical protein
MSEDANLCSMASRCSQHINSHRDQKTNAVRGDTPSAPSTLRRFGQGHQRPINLAAIRRALENGGVKFIAAGKDGGLGCGLEGDLRPIT